MEKKDAPAPVIRNYKDTVFRMIYKDAEELLALYNAVNGTCYEDSEEMEITTLDNAVYMNMKNDISCILDMRMNLYEHQSTVNPNIPLRDLFYVARLYEKFTAGKDIYSTKEILLPTPRFIIFYNGREVQPERKVIKLSDSFEREGEVNLELTVVQLNINPGYNEELKRECPSLHEYMCYVEKVRVYKETMPIEKAVGTAVDECIKEGILADFFRKNKAEAIQMSIFEYDEELHNKTLRQEGYEDGHADGKTEGKAESVLYLLETKGTVPDDLRKTILSMTDTEVLKGWLMLAAEAASVEEFQSQYMDINVPTE